MKRSLNTIKTGLQAVKDGGEVNQIGQFVASGQVEEALRIMDSLFPSLCSSGLDYYELYKYETQEYNPVGYAYNEMMDDVVEIWKSVLDTPRMTNPLKERLFYILLESLHVHINYNEADILFYINRMCSQLAIQLGKVDDYIDYVNQARRHVCSFTEKEYMLQAFKVLFSAGKKAEGMELAHREIPKFSMLGPDIGTALLEEYQDLAHARELIMPHYHKSLEEKMFDLSGERVAWQGLTVNLLRSEGDKEALKQCLLDVLLQPEAIMFSYYMKELRTLTTDEEWAALYTDLEKAAIAESQWFNVNRFPEGQAELYVVANDLDKLLKLLQEHKYPYLEKYIGYLVPEYEKEVIDVIFKYFDSKIKKEPRLQFVENEVKDIIPKIPQAVDILNNVFLPLGKTLRFENGRVSFEMIGT